MKRPSEGADATGYSRNVIARHGQMNDIGGGGGKQIEQVKCYAIEIRGAHSEMLKKLATIDTVEAGIFAIKDDVVKGYIQLKAKKTVEGIIAEFAKKLGSCHVTATPRGRKQNGMKIACRDVVEAPRETRISIGNRTLCDQFIKRGASQQRSAATKDDYSKDISKERTTNGLVYFKIVVLIL